jgi:hypothetical protein
LATDPVARRCAHVTVLSPSARHADRLQAKRFADRLVTIASNNPADVVHEWAANEVALLLDAASRRPESQGFPNRFVFLCLSRVFLWSAVISSLSSRSLYLPNSELFAVYFGPCLIAHSAWNR